MSWRLGSIRLAATLPALLGRLVVFVILLVVLALVLLVRILALLLIGGCVPSLVSVAVTFLLAVPALSLVALLLLALILLRTRTVVFGARERLWWRRRGWEDELFPSGWTKSRAVVRGNGRMCEDEGQELLGVMMARLE